VYLDAWVAAESAKAVGRAGKRIAARTGRWRRLCAPRRCNDIPPASSTSRRRALGSSTRSEMVAYSASANGLI
jgi:hypothetical protein